MERITDRGIEIPALISENEIFWLKLYEKLTKYEDLEEEGLLVVLPCKVGDAVWRIKKGICPEKGTCVSGDVCSEMIMGICPDYSGKPTVERSTFRLCDYNDFGKTVFLSREAAEAALKERENDG